MGTGKSSAAIRYMNEHKNDKFIYITPYLEEAARIKQGCPALRFVEPTDKLPKYECKKTVHTAALIKEGRNITTTHQAFRRYTAETLEDIKSHGYTLMIDENVEVLEAFDFHQDDMQLAIDAGYISDDDGVYTIHNPDYKGRALRELFSLLKSRELIRMTDKDNNSLFYWALPPSLITSFKDVFILTYLFQGQSLHHFMRIYDIPYEYIGIERTEDGGYRFGSYPGYTPEYVSKLKDMLHILDNDKINSIGDDYYALSKSWFDKGTGVDQLKKNMHNYFNNIHAGIPASQKLWGVFKDADSVIRGKGYTKSFLTFNVRATNAYRDRFCLAYLPNAFMNVNEKTFYQKRGVQVDEDMFALSIMVQWIWRSAIRDGEEVYLYIPSRRMRTLLENWIERTMSGGNTIYEETMQ